MTTAHEERIESIEQKVVQLEKQVDRLITISNNTIILIETLKKHLESIEQIIPYR